MTGSNLCNSADLSQRESKNTLHYVSLRTISPTYNGGWTSKSIHNNDIPKGGKHISDGGTTKYNYNIHHYIFQSYKYINRSSHSSSCIVIGCFLFLPMVGIDPSSTNSPPFSSSITIFLSIIERYYLSLEVSISPTLLHVGCRPSPHPRIHHTFEQAIAQEQSRTFFTLAQQ